MRTGNCRSEKTILMNKFMKSRATVSWWTGVPSSAVCTVTTRRPCALYVPGRESKHPSTKSFCRQLLQRNPQGLSQDDSHQSNERDCQDSGRITRERPEMA